MDSIIDSLYKHVKCPKARMAIYTDIVDAFEDHDCDVLEECTGVDPVYDAFIKERYKEYDD